MLQSINSHKVQIFSKSSCPHCTKTKNMFAKLKVEVNIEELNQIADGAAIQNELLQLTGQRTVPSIFINGKHLGGNSDAVEALQSGKLIQLLAEAGVDVAAQN